MGEIQSNDILLEAENPEKLTYDDLKTIKKINEALRCHDGKDKKEGTDMKYLKYLEKKGNRISLEFKKLQTKLGENLTFIEDSEIADNNRHIEGLNSMYTSKENKGFEDLKDKNFNKKFVEKFRENFAKSELKRILFDLQDEQILHDSNRKTIVEEYNNLKNNIRGLDKTFKGELQTKLEEKMILIRSYHQNTFDRQIDEKYYEPKNNLMKKNININEKDLNFCSIDNLNSGNESTIQENIDKLNQDIHKLQQNNIAKRGNENLKEPTGIIGGLKSILTYGYIGPDLPQGYKGFILNENNRMKSKNIDTGNPENDIMKRDTTSNFPTDINNDIIDIEIGVRNNEDLIAKIQKTREKLLYDKYYMNTNNEELSEKDTTKPLNFLNLGEESIDLYTNLFNRFSSNKELFNNVYTKIETYYKDNNIPNKDFLNTSIRINDGTIGNIGEIKQNKKTGSRSNPDGSTTLNVVGEYDSILNKKVNGSNFKENLFKALGFENIEKDSTLIEKRNILMEWKGNKTSIEFMETYHELYKTKNLTEYGEALKRKTLLEDIPKLGVMPTHLEIDFVNIVDGFQDKVYEDFKNNRKCYIGSDGKVHGGEKEQRENIKLPEGKNLQDFIKNDFKKISPKYETYEEFMHAMQSKETTFSGKNTLTEYQYKKLFNYIKYGAPEDNPNYKFNTCGENGECKEIKELQLILNKLDPELSNRLDANNNAGVDGKYGFATMETFRSLEGIINLRGNELEYFSHFDQIFLFQDISGSMENVTSIVRNNLILYDNGKTKPTLYGSDGKEKGLDEVYNKLKNPEFYQTLKNNPGEKLFRLYTDELEQSEVAKDPAKLKELKKLLEDINGTCDIVACKYLHGVSPQEIEKNGIDAFVISFENLVNYKNIIVSSNNTKTENLYEKVETLQNVTHFNLTKVPEIGIMSIDKCEFLSAIVTSGPRKLRENKSEIENQIKKFELPIEDVYELVSIVQDFKKLSPIEKSKQEKSFSERFWPKFNNMVYGTNI